jgi:hypothetical protein
MCLATFVRRMVPLSRRRLVRVAASVAVAGVAGCSRVGVNADASNPTPTATATAQPGLAYDALTVRNPADEPFVEYDPENPEPDESDEFLQRTLATPGDADRVSFTGDVTGVDEARAFLAATDFDRSVVHVSEQRIPECRALEVDYVTADGNSFDLDFCSPLRPADVACRLDERDVVAAFVRFPMATDTVSLSTVGSGGSCDRPRRPERREPDRGELSS